MKMQNLRAGSNRLRSGEGRDGFTLIELLLVITVVGILASLLLPALARAKAKGESIVCLGIERQLIFASFLYANDQEDALPNNFGVKDTLKTIEDQTYLNWVNNLMTWDLDERNTNTFLITAGGLGPYLSGSAKTYKCPADFALSDVQREAGWTARTRSFSMNAMTGNAGDFTRGGTNVNNPHYEQFFKLTEIQEPARIFLFIEEHPDSINDGYFVNKAYSREWHDLPASYHNGAANLAFADGHIETHRWRFPSTKPPPHPDAAKLLEPIPPPELEDFDWIMQRTSRRR